YRKQSGGKIVIEKLNPQPDTDAEDFANMDGVEAKMVSFGGEPVYLGLCLEYIDQKTTIPFMTPDRDKFLEYDISRAISQVINPSKAVIGVISGLPIFGQPMNPMMMQMGQ